MSIRLAPLFYQLNPLEYEYMEKGRYYHSRNQEETYALGQELGASFCGGEVIALYGDLGAGKTAFSQGLAAGLGVKSTVNSPTFTIMKLYALKQPSIKQFCHVDAYRLNSAQELLDIGIADYLGVNDTVCAIEWAEKVEAILPKKRINIYLKAISENERQIIIK